ncbi:MAG: cell envelope integrity protein CreD [Pseudomonadota bacterium]
MKRTLFDKLKSSLGHRLIVIALITLAMGIPLNMVSGVISERHHYYDSVLMEIASLWGAQQTIVGPIIVVPFIEKYESEEELENSYGHTETKRKTRYVRKTAVFLPDDLDVSAELKEDYRERGIYRSLVYAAQYRMTGKFSDIDLSTLSNSVDEVLYAEAEIIIGLSDTKAIDQINAVSWNGKDLSVVSGVGSSGILHSGFSAKLSGDLNSADEFHFDIDLSVNGSHGVRFAPLGETTNVTMRSSWPHPKFAGQLLPDNHEINAEGFIANWRIPHLARNYPQQWVTEKSELNVYELLAGVDLFEPVFIYSKINRAVKYGLLFIALTFITFFIFESTAGSTLHYIQYGLVGVSLAFFYLLLLSLSEHLHFSVAYFISALTCVGLISSYVGYALANRSRGIVLFWLLSGLFTAIYTLLRLEDYALLMGTLLLLISLAGLMFLTKDLNSAPSDTVDA